MMAEIVLDCPGSFYMGNWGNMGWFGFPLFGILLISTIIIIFLIVYSVDNSKKQDHFERTTDAQKILDDRYAKGEITRKEYNQAKEDIQHRN